MTGINQKNFNTILLGLFDRLDPLAYMLCLEDYFGIRTGQA